MQRNYCLLFLLSCFSYFITAAQKPQPPTAKKGGKTYTEHGNNRIDDYFWMNTPDSATIAHLKAENAYTEAYLKHTEPLQAKIYDELIARMEQRYESLPVKENGYWYYSRFEEGKQYPGYYRRKGSMTANEELMLDVNAMAKGYQIYIVRNWEPSRNNRYLAFAIDTTGDRRCLLQIKDLRTGQLLPDKMNNTSGSMAWANDGRTLYYVVNDPAVRSYKVMRHVLGEDVARDKEVYTETDNTYSVGLYAARNNRYIFIQSRSTTTTEAHYLDANRPAADPVLMQARTKDVEYTPNYYEGNVFHIYTNKDARNFKYVAAPIANPSMENWKDLMAHQPGKFLERVYVLKNYMVAQTKENGLTQIAVMNRKTGRMQKIPFAENAYVADMSLATDDFSSDSIRIYYTSLITPGTDFKYNITTGQKTQLKQQKVGGGFNAAHYKTERIWATAADGTKIPVSIAYRNEGFKKDGSNPLFLYAYGSYGANSDPYFNTSVFSLLDRGFVFGIAHIRGGQELGREWYESGKLLKKKNTFTDFIDAAQYLVKEKYTSPDRLFANGGSAGGMLMGAVTNMRPDLFRGIIAEVPWMDVISDMFDPNLPLVTLEYDEWGNPSNKEYYDYMLSWSPLDNVKPAKYPAILATGGLHDTQVPYFSPAKWVAKVREYNQGTHPVLLKVNMGAGHGGESGRFERQKLTALKYAFALDQLGWDEQTKTYNTGKSF